ncbi:hypothetical protein PHYSODRAFT_521795 [Phytophthora sojae]|uniref:Uncharacterized protein n=1 Tax=Phytophthora sojae (strain P6497) TaxID=1094619 RepID=G5A2H9_PHYSP|nr:hypothetical protein PHYSODRAFT_521795 [Phytophthora sojae]EGZ09870.1 hypothetical protein PHYSODRAFT_521795 [Phytophthora sojae]|eukprot:XP_009534731.1 hypothetical protein PHYSODRAFT_521795 [Phytophthora sojae]
MRFIVLESSSGTGKTQMAFNLETTEACDVFYVLCTPVADRDQDVYRAFATRSNTFVECLSKDLEVLKTGSFGITTKLYEYAFIAAAVRGDDTFQGRARREQVEEALDRRKQMNGGKPFVFFLDEFPRIKASLCGHERKEREAMTR